MAERVTERLEQAQAAGIVEKITAQVADGISDAAEGLLGDGGPDPDACLRLAGEIVTYILAQLGRVVGIVQIELPEE